MTLLWWFVETTLVAGTLAALVWCVCRVLRSRLGPGARHALWLVVLIKLLSPPLLSWPTFVATPVVPPPAAKVEVPVASAARLIPDDFDREWSRDRIVPRPAETARVEPVRVEPVVAPRVATAPVTVPFVPRTTLVRPRDWSWVPPALISIWVLGALLELARQSRRAIRFGRRLKSAKPAPDWLADQIDEVSARIGVASPPTMVLDRLGGPLIWCWGKPVLIVPTELLDALGDERWSGVLIHELAHLRRGDPWIARLDLVAGAVWWFSPVYRFVRARLAEEAELACDAWVVHLEPDAVARRGYAEVLVDVCEHLALSTSKVALCFGSKGGIKAMEGRLLMILKEVAPNPKPGRWALAAAALTLLALPGWSPRQAGKPAASKPTVSKPSSSESRSEDPKADRPLKPTAPSATPSAAVETSPKPTVMKPGSARSSAETRPSDAKETRPLKPSSASTATPNPPGPSTSAKPEAAPTSAGRTSAPWSFQARVKMCSETRFGDAAQAKDWSPLDLPAGAVLRVVAVEVTDLRLKDRGQVFVDSVRHRPRGDGDASQGYSRLTHYDDGDTMRTFVGDLQSGAFVPMTKTQEYPLPTRWRPEAKNFLIVDAVGLLRDFLRPGSPYELGERIPGEEIVDGVRVARYRSAQDFGPAGRIVATRARAVDGGRASTVRAEFSYTPKRNDTAFPAQRVQIRYRDFDSSGYDIPTKIEAIEDWTAPDGSLIRRTRYRATVDSIKTDLKLTDADFRVRLQDASTEFDEDGDGPARGALQQPRVDGLKVALPDLGDKTTAALRDLESRSSFGPVIMERLTQVQSGVLPPATRPGSPMGATTSSYLPTNGSISMPAPSSTFPADASPALAPTSDPANLAPTSTIPADAAPALAPTSDPANLAPTSTIPADAAPALAPTSDPAILAPSSTIPADASPALAPTRAMVPPPAVSVPLDPLVTSRPLPSPAAAHIDSGTGSPDPTHSTTALPEAPEPNPFREPGPAARRPRTSPAVSAPRVPKEDLEVDPTASPSSDRPKEPAGLDEIRDEIELQELRSQSKEQSLNSALNRMQILDESRALMLKRVEAGQASRSELDAKQLSLLEAKERAGLLQAEIREAKLLLAQAKRRLERETKRLDARILRARENVDRLKKLGNLISPSEVRDAQRDLEALIEQRGPIAPEASGPNVAPH